MLNRSELRDIRWLLVTKNRDLVQTNADKKNH